MRLDFDHIPPFYEDDPNEPHGVNMIVETPRGAHHKYAYKEKYGIIELRRILRGGLSWPCDFGFLPQTLADDGDALDIALLIDEPCFPGCFVRARVLGSIGLVKNGTENDRLLACPISLPGAASVWDEVHDLDDVSSRLMEEIQAFLKDYLVFEGHRVELTGVQDAFTAMETVRKAAARWQIQQHTK